MSASAHGTAVRGAATDPAAPTPALPDAAATAIATAAATLAALSALPKSPVRPPRAAMRKQRAGGPSISPGDDALAPHARGNI